MFVVYCIDDIKLSELNLTYFIVCGVSRGGGEVGGVEGWILMCSSLDDDD